LASTFLENVISKFDARHPGAIHRRARLADTLPKSQNFQTTNAAMLTNKGVAIKVYLPSMSVGNMHSTRSSCAVMHCGVPTVVIKEK
jgi:hypothetical protein